MSQTTNPFARPTAAAENPFAAAPAASTPAADPTPPAPGGDQIEVPGDLEELLDRAEALRIEKAEIVGRIDAERAAVAAAIFHATGGVPGKHEVGGRSFTFRKPSPRRSTDYGLLEAAYPDAYAAAVKTTEPDPDAIPALVLGKGFAK